MKQKSLIEVILETGLPVYLNYEVTKCPECGTDLKDDGYVVECPGCGLTATTEGN